MPSALIDLHRDTGSFFDRSGVNPVKGSLADVELRASDLRPYPEFAYSQGQLLVEAAADHLVALTRVIIEPIQTIAPWTLLRGILESSALGVWLLEPCIGARERAGRSAGFRFEGMKHHATFVRVVGTESEHARVTDRIEHIVKEARLLGLSEIRDRKQRLIGIGHSVPSATDLVSRLLKEEGSFRLLSAMAHAHPWAQQQLGFRQVASDVVDPIRSDSGLQKHLAPESFVFLCHWAARGFSKVIWKRCELFGWHSAELRDIIAESFGVLGLADERLPWKEDVSAAPAG